MIHVYPTNDTFEHDTENGTSCRCEPEVEFVEGGDVMVVHNAFDGREIIEEVENGFI